MRFREFKKFRTQIVSRPLDWTPEVRDYERRAYQVLGRRSNYEPWTVLAVFPSRSGAREYIRLMKRGRAAAVQQKGRTIAEHLSTPNPLLDELPMRAVTS